MTTKSVTQTKGSTKQKSAARTTTAINQAAETKITVNELAANFGLTPKRLRAYLRAEYPRDIKGKKWEITAILSRKIEKDYKANLKAKEDAKKTQETLLEKEKISNNLETNIEIKPNV